jgi:hypothetical protein
MRMTALNTFVTKVIARFARSLAPVEKSQGTNSGPEAVRSLENQHQVPALHLGHELA